MGKSVQRGGKNAKSGHFQIRNQNCQIRNQISPVMEVMKNRLPKDKAAFELHYLTQAPVSTCQKLLSGHRAESYELFVTLLKTDHGWASLQATMGTDPSQWPEWYAELRDLADIAELKRDQVRMQRAIDSREKRRIESKVRS